MRIGDGIKNATSSVFVSADQIAAEHLVELHERTGNWCVIPTLLPTLTDIMLGGFSPGVHYLAGMTGISKTGLALQLARKTAEADIPVVFISLELDPGEILTRMVSQDTDLPWAEVRAGEHNVEAAEVWDQLQGLPLYFVTKTDNFSQILNDIHKMDRPPLVILDYLQIAADTFIKRHDPRERVSEICKMLSNFSKARQCPVLAISSIARSKYQDMEPTPEGCLSAAKESGQVEYEATSLSVLMVQGDSEECPRSGFWVLAKHRYGRSGKVRILIDGRKGTIQEATDSETLDAIENREVLRLLRDPPKPPKKGSFAKVPTMWNPEEVAKYRGRPRVDTAKRMNSLRDQGLLAIDAHGGWTTTVAGLANLRTDITELRRDKEEQ